MLGLKLGFGSTAGFLGFTEGFVAGARSDAPPVRGGLGDTGGPAESRQAGGAGLAGFGETGLVGGGGGGGRELRGLGAGTGADVRHVAVVVIAGSGDVDAGCADVCVWYGVIVIYDGDVIVRVVRVEWLSW